jgi:hypothetical protein
MLEKIFQSKRHKASGYRSRLLAAFAATFGLTACSESNFQGGATKVQETIDEITIPGTETKTLGEPVPVKNGLVNLKFSPAGDGQVDGNKVRRPLIVYFALDITQSMGPNIQAIKDNIARFVTELQGKGFEPRIGMVTFRDAVTETFSLSSDVDAFKNFVSSLKATGGQYANEASLLALEEVLKRMASEDSSSDALRTVLLVTDNPGHRGTDTHSGISSSECELASTVSAFNALSKADQERTRVYHSVSPFVARVVSPCSGFNDAKAQMSRFLSDIFPSVSKEDRGSELQWPFTGDTLVNEFVGKLEKTLPPVEAVCLATSAELLLDGQRKAKWQPVNKADVLEAHLKKQSLEIPRAISKGDLPAFEAGSPQLKVTRCCVVSSKVESKDLDTCDLEREQIVDFKLEVKED